MDTRIEVNYLNGKKITEYLMPLSYILQIGQIEGYKIYNEVCIYKYIPSEPCQTGGIFPELKIPVSSCLIVYKDEKPLTKEEIKKVLDEQED